MRSFLVIFSLTLVRLTSWAQEKFEPAIVFIYPNEISIENNLEEDLSLYNKEIEITDELVKSYVQEGLAANWKIIRNKELEFIQKQEFVTLLVLAFARELTYKEVEYHENLLIYPVKEKIPVDRIAYKKMADQLGMSWLVNVYKVSLAEEAGKKRLTIHIQLYNVITNRLFLDQTYSISEVESEPCEEGIWYCMVQSIKNKITTDIGHQVDKNRQYHK